MSGSNWLLTTFNEADIAISGISHTGNLGVSSRGSIDVNIFVTNNSEIPLAESVANSIHNMNASRILTVLATNSGLSEVSINISTFSPSMAVRYPDGTALVVINPGDVARSYGTLDGRNENFTLEHIIAHEFVHVFVADGDGAAIDNGITHNTLVNESLQEMPNAGSPRSYDYFDAHCFLAGTSISMWKGSDRPIESIRVGDWVTSYDKDGNLVSHDGLIIGPEKGFKTGMPFFWRNSQTLPKPEDYILQRSKVTLEDVYGEAAWGDMAPVLAAP